MSLMSAFKIGVRNTWVFIAYLMLSFIPFFYVAIKQDVPSVGEMGLSGEVKMLASSSKLLLFLVMIYSIFLPIQLGTVWFFVCLPITLLGLIAYTVVRGNWAVTPMGRAVSRELYRYSRHPIYVTMFIFLSGLGIITASWVLLPFFIIMVVGCVVYANVEKQSCLYMWGDSYREYMNRTPMLIGMPYSSEGC